MSVTKKISVLFWLRKSRTKKEANTVPLYCRVTVGGQRYDFSCFGISLIRFSAQAESDLESAMADFQQVRDMEMSIPF